MPDLERSTQGLANLGCRADFSRSCSDFHSLFRCQDNPGAVENVCVWISPRTGQFATGQELCADVVPGSSQASHTHLGINVSSSGCSPSPVVEKKDPKKAALGDGHFSDSCYNRALIFNRSLQTSRTREGISCFPPWSPRGEGKQPETTRAPRALAVNQFTVFHRNCILIFIPNKISALISVLTNTI